MNKKPSEFKIKPKTVIIILIICYYVLHIAITSGDEESRPFYMLLIAVVIIPVVVFIIVSESIGEKRRKETALKRNAGKSSGAERPVGTVTQAAAGQTGNIGASGNSKPMSQQDIDRKLSQLEGFLKNGIIDRDEYSKLKKKYTQGK